MALNEHVTAGKGVARCVGQQRELATFAVHYDQDASASSSQSNQLLLIASAADFDPIRNVASMCGSLAAGLSTGIDVKSVDARLRQSSRKANRVRALSTADVGHNVRVALD